VPEALVKFISAVDITLSELPSATIDITLPLRSYDRLYFRTYRYTTTFVGADTIDTTVLELPSSTIDTTFSFWSYFR
jgi:hypothetical protein